MPTVRPSIENLRSLGMFTQNNRWNIEFEKFPAGLPNTYSSDDINWRAESMALPKLNPNMVEIKIRGNTVFQPGVGEYENPLTLTCIETVDNKISQFIKDWRSLHWSSADGLGITQNKADLEATVIIVLLDNLDQPRWFYKLIGCILESPSQGDDVGADTADPAKPTLSLRYDYFIDWAA